MEENIATFESIEQAINEGLQNDQNVFSIACPSVYRSKLVSLRETCPAKFVAMGLGLSYTLRFAKQGQVPLEYSELTPKVRQTFINMSKLKIPCDLKDSDIQTLDPIIGITKWVQLLIDAVRTVGGERQFIDKHYSIETKVQDLLKSRPTLQQWANVELTPEKMMFTAQPSTMGTTRKAQTNIYHKLNHQQKFISIDIKSANFQVLKMHKVIEENDWNELVSKFSPHEYFTKVKGLRIKTLSHDSLQPKKQKVQWENMMKELLTFLINSAKLFKETDFAIFNSDEVVFRDNGNEPRMISEVLKSSTLGEWKNHVRVSQFTLIAIPNTQYYVKKKDDQTIEFKCVRGDQILDAIEKYKLIDV